MQRLTERQRRFAELYPSSLNATAAAIEAGFSRATAKSQGSRLLRHPGVANAIRIAIDQATEDAGVKSTWVMSRLRQIASSSPSEESWRGGDILAALGLLAQCLRMLPKDGVGVAITLQDLVPSRHRDLGELPAAPAASATLTTSPSAQLEPVPVSPVSAALASAEAPVPEVVAKPAPECVHDFSGSTDGYCRRCRSAWRPSVDSRGIGTTPGSEKPRQAAMHFDPFKHNLKS